MTPGFFFTVPEHIIPSSEQRKQISIALYLMMPGKLAGARLQPYAWKVACLNKRKEEKRNNKTKGIHRKPVYNGHDCGIIKCVPVLCYTHNDKKNVKRHHVTDIRLKSGMKSLNKKKRDKSERRNTCSHGHGDGG